MHPSTTPTTRSHRWSGPVPLAALLLALALLVPAAHATAAPGGRDTDRGGPPGAARAFTLTNYNIAHGRGQDGVVDLDRTADVIRSSGAAVATLQEVDRHWSSRSSLLDQASALSDLLGVDHAYGANLDRPPLVPGDPNRQYGTATLSALPILEQRNTLLPKADEREEQRGLLEVLLDIDGVETWVLTTHLDHTSVAARELQVAAILDRVVELDGPVILTGDLNAEPDDPELAPLFGVFEDAWDLAGEGDGYTFRSTAPTKRIDFVLVTPGIEVTAAEVPATEASDHLPVVAELEVSPRSAGQRRAAEARSQRDPAAAPPPSLRSAPERPVAAYGGELPLGSPALDETRTTEQVAGGVTHTRIVRGENSDRNRYTIDVARLETEEAARALARDLRRDGFRPRVDAVDSPADSERDVQLWLVRVGSAPDRAALTPLLGQLRDAGHAPLGTVYLPWTGGPTTGPWDVNVLRIDASALDDGRVSATLAGDQVRGTATIPDIAAAHDAVAVTNAGFFVTATRDGTLGQLAGISMVDGTLVSEAVDGRTSLVLPASGTPVVSALSTELTVRSETGGQRHVDGLNRAPGLIRSCGGSGGDLPTLLPRHDVTCTDADELIHVTPIFDTTTEPGPGAEVVLDADGTVVEVRDERGGAIPDDGSVLSATGDAIDWLVEHATEGTQLEIDQAIEAADAELPDDTRHIVNGGPRLVSGGELDIPAATEGFDWPDDPRFYYGWVAARHPRTVAGTTADGDLLLITIDGRGDHSVGATLRENARILQSFAVEEGLNLDGGGSTFLMLGDEVANVPSDRDPYRPVADALLIAP